MVTIIGTRGEAVVAGGCSAIRPVQDFRSVRALRAFRGAPRWHGHGAPRSGPAAVKFSASALRIGISLPHVAAIRELLFS